MRIKNNFIFFVKYFKNDKKIIKNIIPQKTSIDRSGDIHFFLMKLLNHLPYNNDKDIF